MHHHSLSVYYLIMHTKKFKKFARVCLILYTEEREREEKVVMKKGKEGEKKVVD